MRTLKYIIGISLAVGLVACDDFLVETPQTAFEKEGIYNTCLLYTSDAADD